MNRVILTAAVLFSLASPASAETSVVNAGTPAPECTARVNFDRNADLPGYLAREGVQPVCIPFMPIAQRIPAGGDADFYVRSFTDAAIRARYADCLGNPACVSAARAGATTFTAAERRRTGTVDAMGRIDPQGEVDLRAIRRPAFFGQGGRTESIAAAEPRTHVVEFTVPRDPYERLHLRREDPIRLRGWYIEGAGVADGAGGLRRALVIMNNGGGNEITGIDDPAFTGVARNPQGRFVGVGDTGRSEQPGMRHWRGFAAALNSTGFDVLVTDRRGNGISGGVSGFNTLEQARDMTRQLEAMESGDGLRILTPDGQLLAGDATRGRLLAGLRAREIPIVIAGYSRGSYATAWAMHRNVVADCDRDMPEGACRAPLGWANIRGAILYGPNSGGLGTRVAGHDMIEAALRIERNTAYYPDGEVLEGVARWPAVMIARGTWDYVEGLEGSLEAYRRAQGLKEIFVFRGPHQLATQHEENMRRVGERLAAFARAAVLGHAQAEGAQTPADLRDLVLSSAPFWEHTSAPAN